MDDWNQSGENSKKEPGHLFERLEGKLISLSYGWGGDEVRGQGSRHHDSVRQKPWNSCPADEDGK